MDEEVRRLMCKGKEYKERHKDGSRIDPRVDVVIKVTVWWTPVIIPARSI